MTCLKQKNTPHANVRTQVIERLDDNERSAMERKLGHVSYPDATSTTDAELEDFVAISRDRVLGALPSRIYDALLQWKSLSEEVRPGIVVIDNLPIDANLPPTPIDGHRSPDKTSNISEATLVGFGTMLGEIFCFRAERGGQSVQDLAAVKGKAQELTNEGAVKLGWHTEHAATGLTFDPPTDVVAYLMFFGLRADPGGKAKTLVSDIRDALSLLDQEHIETLRKPLFNLRPPLLVRRSIQSDERLFGPTPLLLGPRNAPQIRAALYGDLTVATPPEAQAAIRQLKRALTSTQRGIFTKPGRLAIVDNRTVCHSRSPYSPRFDGSDRWLQRVMVTESLYNLRKWRHTSHRVLDVG